VAFLVWSFRDPQMGNIIIDKETTMGREEIDREFILKEGITHSPMPNDPWQHRAEHMLCATCMWSVIKSSTGGKTVGRCRRHAPTMSGYPAIFKNDWCGDHKIDENKV